MYPNMGLISVIITGNGDVQLIQTDSVEEMQTLPAGDDGHEGGNTFVVSGPSV